MVKRRKVPIIREVGWLMLVPQLAVLAGLTGVLFLFLGRFNSALLWGAVVYLGYSMAARHLVARHHRAGIRATAAGRHEEAIQHFAASYDFFRRHEWADRWRSIVLMSSSAASFGEMALVNKAFCQAQLGRLEEARGSYELANATYPDSPIASAALKLMGTVERTGKKVVNHAT